MTRMHVILGLVSRLPEELYLCLYVHSGHYNIFVGDLSPEVTDAMLFACFSVYSTCS